VNSYNTLSKLALGTVQFGLPYGVSNQIGQVKPSEVSKILNLAVSKGINTLDTAIAYGSSETVLGEHNLEGFDIITKLPFIPEDVSDITGWVEEQMINSLDRLNTPKVNAVLLHRPEQLISEIGVEIYAALTSLKSRGLTERIGISIYSPDEFLNLSRDFRFDLIQAPFNVLDTRLQDAGAFDVLESQDTQLHVRSIFLQGLLLMDKKQRPNKFNHWSRLWTKWEEWLNENNLTPLEACIRHALSIPQIEKVVVGVDSANQLQEIVTAADGSLPIIPSDISCRDEKLLSPHLWNQL